MNIILDGVGADGQVVRVNDDSVNVTFLRCPTEILQELEDFRIGHPQRDFPGRVTQHVGHVQIHIVSLQELHTGHLKTLFNWIDSVRIGSLIIL